MQSDDDLKVKEIYEQALAAGVLNEDSRAQFIIENEPHTYPENGPTTPARSMYLPLLCG